MDPRTLVSIRYKTRNLARGPNFDTDSWGLSPKATGLHLVGVRGNTLTADPRTLHSIRLKYEIWSVGRKFDTDSGGLNPKATGLHLVGVGGVGSTLALPASWAEVEGLNGGPQNFGFYSI